VGIRRKIPKSASQTQHIENSTTYEDGAFISDQRSIQSTFRITIGLNDYLPIVFPQSSYLIMAYFDNSPAPTFIGHISAKHNTKILVKYYIRGLLKPIPRRLRECKQDKLIQSGNVFIYKEDSSRIIQWTNGKR